MTKKTVSKIAAFSLAVASIVPTFSMVAFAADNLQINGSSASGYVWKVVTTSTVNGATVTNDPVYYTSEAMATAAASDVTATKVSVTTVYSGKTIYLNTDGSITTTKPSDNATGYKVAGSSTSTSTGTTTTGAIIPTSDRYASSTMYKGSNGMWYPNLASLKAATGSSTYTETKSSNYSSVYCYFNPYYGTYESVSTDFNVYIPTTVATTTTTTTAIYSVNGVYYYTYSSAYAAANGNTSLIRTYTNISSGQYFSKVTGAFYSTYSAALVASNNNPDLVINTGYYYNDYYDYYDYYYNNYLYGYNGYYGNYYGSYSDPYYYYFWNKNNSTSSSSDSTTATLGNMKGWTTVAKYLKKASTGKTYTIDMNKETTVPSSVLSAIKGRKITLKFVLDNGVTYTVDGREVTTAKDVNLNTRYNTNNISKKLIKAAYKKNDAVSSAQISVSEGSLGFTSEITVKFSSKRAGYKAKIYRYNSAKNSLQLVDTAKISSNGNCTFDKITKGGDFVIVLYK